MTATMPDTYRISDAPDLSTALAIRPTVMGSIEEVRAAMALRDDEQILSECQGAVAQEWLYSFSIGGKTIEGISVSGATEIARIRSEAGFPLRFVSVLPEQVEQNGVLGLRVTVIARDQRSGAEGVGMAFYPWHDDKGRPVPFADRKALACARRNAILQLVPVQQIKALLKAAKESASGKVPRKPEIARPPRPEARRVTGPENLKPRDAYAGTDEKAEGTASEAQMLEIARLMVHPACAGIVRESVEAKLAAGKYNTAHMASTCIEALKRTISDAGGARHD